jgi:hypothetical protein
MVLDHKILLISQDYPHPHVSIMDSGRVISLTFRYLMRFPYFNVHGPLSYIYICINFHDSLDLRYVIILSIFLSSVYSLPIRKTRRSATVKRPVQEMQDGKHAEGRSMGRMTQLGVNLFYLEHHSAYWYMNIYSMCIACIDIYKTHIGVSNYIPNQQNDESLMAIFNKNRRVEAMTKS